MSEKSREELKKFFRAGKKPSQGQYFHLIDSFINKNESETQQIASDVSASSFVAGKHISASGNISASGKVEAPSGSFNIISGSEKIIGEFGTLGKGGITSSGNISASGNIIADTGSFRGGISSSKALVINDITSSGELRVTRNIEALGYVSASTFAGDGSGLTNITSTTTTISLVTASLATGSLIISGNTTYTSASAARTLSVEVSGSILPKANNIDDIGSPTKFFRAIHVDNIVVSNSIIPTGDNISDIGSTARQYKGIHASTASIGELHDKPGRNQITVKSTLMPSASANILPYDAGLGHGLGTYDNIWANAHAQAMHNTFTFTDTLSGSEGGNVTIGSTNFYRSLINVSASLTPGTDHLYELGNAVKSWKQIYVGTASIDHIESKTTEMEVFVSGNLLPHGNFLYDLGRKGSNSSGPGGSGVDGVGRQWRHLYLEGTASLNMIAGDSAAGGVLYYTGSSINPTINRGASLGTNSYQWDYVYAHTVDVGILTDSPSNNITVSASLVPAFDDSFNFGSSQKEWKDIFIDGNASIDTLTNSSVNSAGSGQYQKINVSASLYPYDNNTWNVGQSSSIWKDIWSHRINLNTLDASGSDQEITVVGHLVPYNNNVYDLG